MSTYISKKSINNYPIPEQEMIFQSSNSRKLRSKLLSDNSYLLALSKDLSIKPLSINNTDADAVSVIWVALLAIETITANSDIEFNLPNSLMSSSRTVFDENVKLAVEIFQQFANLPVTGIIDRNTLFKIDSYLTKEVIKNYLEFSGVRNEVPISIKRVDGNTSLLFSFDKDGEIVSVNISQEIISATPLVGKRLDYSDGKLPVNLDNKLRADLKALNNELGDRIDGVGVIYIRTEGLGMSDGTGTSSPITKQKVLQAKENVIPTNYENSNFEIRELKATDNFVDIVLEKYYSGSEVIHNSFIDNDVPIFILPARTPLPDRTKDARFQFYLNLLYYCNSSEENGIVSEYGMLSADGYQRYDVEDLKNYNVFDNVFDPNNPETDNVLPNYYRFIKAQEQVNSNTRIKFSTDGSLTTSFIPNPGKSIRIPSRKFADSLYYHINFRPNEMLTNPAGDTSPEYVAASVFAATAMQMANTTFFGSLQSWLQDEITTLYNETLDFFNSAYNFAIQKLTQTWPRGTGCLLNGGIGVTWGYPIATDFSAEKQVWRKMTKYDELTIMYSEELEFYAGLDVAVGSSIGGNFGQGESKSGIGIKYIAGVEAGYRVSTVMEYEFPIRPAETGLISAIIAAFGGAAVNCIVDFLDHFDFVNISPRHYLTKLEATQALELKGNAALQAGYNSGLKVQTETSSEQEQEATKSGINIHNVLSKLNLPGIELNGEMILGKTWSYQAKYDNNCKVARLRARVPKEVEVETKYFGKASLTSGVMGGFLNSFFLGNSIVDFLNFGFDKGVLFALNYKMERDGNPQSLDLSQLSLRNLNAQNNPIIDANNGEIKYQGKKWTSHFKLGFYSGSVDDLCENGTEALIKLNTYKIKQIRDNILSFNFGEINDLGKLFYSFSYRFKIAGGSGEKKHKISDAVFNAYKRGNGLEIDTKRRLLENASSLPFGFNYGAGLLVGFEIKFEDVKQLFNYLFKRHCVLNTPNITPIAKQRRKKIIKQKDKNITKSLTGNFVQNRQFYINKYNQLNAFLDNKYPTDLPSAINGESYLKQYQIFCTIAIEFTDYLSSGLFTDERDLDMNDAMHALSYLVDIIDLTVAIEAKLTVNFNMHVKGGEGATVRLALNGEGGFMDNTVLIDEGDAMDINNVNDPIYQNYQEIKKHLGEVAATGYDKYLGIRKAIHNLKES